MIEETALPDGTLAMVMPLLPSDRETVAAEYEKLSTESKRRRFLSPVLHLNEHMLNHLVDGVDGINHVALVLSVEVRDHEFEPVAIARMVRYPDTPDVADLAVTVKDAWQGRGVATTLLPILLKHRPEGVDHILTEVAADNPASLAMLHSLGPTSTSEASPGILNVRVELVSEEPTAPEELEVDREARYHLRTRDLICPWLVTSGFDLPVPVAVTKPFPHITLKRPSELVREQRLRAERREATAKAG